MTKRFRITLLFNANKVYDRQVIEGIGEYLYASNCDWDVFLEDNFVTNIEHFRDWEGDGVIADFDSQEVRDVLKNSLIPVVGVGGSYTNEADYPDVPYVATDNYALVELAFTHLKDKGLENFAFYGIPEDDSHQWAREREISFNKLISPLGYTGETYSGNTTSTGTWYNDMDRLSAWLQALPKPIGIIAATDARARHLLQACDNLNLMIPDTISIIGIDNEELTQYLTRVPLSSVGQGSKRMGHEAAKILHKKLILNEEGDASKLNHARVLVPPAKVFERLSTDFKALNDPSVIQAMHYIRQNACKGIKVEQVLDYVGMSRSNLEGRFKEERGHSIHQEIHDFKLLRACHLLSSTELSIAEISESCGYPSLQYMYSIFKKRYGKTPKMYRNKE